MVRIDNWSGTSPDGLISIDTVLKDLNDDGVYDALNYTAHNNSNTYNSGLSPSLIKYDFTHPVGMGQPPGWTSGLINNGDGTFSPGHLSLGAAADLYAGETKDFSLTGNLGNGNIGITFAKDAYSTNIEIPAPVPEPATVLLLGLGIGMALAKKSVSGMYQAAKNYINK